MIKSSPLFYLTKYLSRLLFGTLWRREIYGEENIPARGGVIIAPNHASIADPPLTGSAMTRPLYFMAKKELFEIPILGFLIKRTHAFPVERGKNAFGAFKAAKKLLDEGDAVLMFPEGTRSKDGNFGKARPGLGMLSCVSQAPVIPVRIINSDKLGRFYALKVIFGKPVYPPKEYNKESYQKLSETVLEAIKNLQ